MYNTIIVVYNNYSIIHCGIMATIIINNNIIITCLTHVNRLILTYNGSMLTSECLRLFYYNNNNIIIINNS